MTERMLADKPERLIALLRRRLPGWKRKTLEQRLLAGCVRVNGETVTRNDLLAAGDEVVVAEQDDSARSAAGAAFRSSTRTTRWSPSTSLPDC